MEPRMTMECRLNHPHHHKHQQQEQLSFQPDPHHQQSQHQQAQEEILANSLIMMKESKYISQLNGRLRKGITASLTPEGRIFYTNHGNKTTSWLPPIDSWDAGDPCLPYGWEIAHDSEGKTYYINHINRTTTYEDPRKDEDETPPQPRDVELFRHSEWGFGFVAGSEKPVIVRSVKEGGPSDDKLLPGDQILKVNGRDMVRAPREEVIEMVKSCKHSVRLTVCQPYSTRKSAILTAAKKAKLKSNPSRVRFAEGVAINGSPLYCPTPFESAVPFLPNVLKVFLENGQTKTFKYDSSITVQDVLNSLIEKLDLRCPEYYSLCTEHIKSVRRNKLTILDPKDTLSKIAARPGAHNLRCLFRMTFVPKEPNQLLERDPNSFEYLYSQCCNDVVQERFTPELKYEIALRLCALHLHQHSLSNGLVNNRGKVNLKAVEKEYGLESFVPYTLMETMKRKQLHKYLNHSAKQNRSLCPSSQKYLTVAQTKVHYLAIISELPCYGAKLFSTNIRDSTAELALLISPKYGISHVTRGRASPITLAKIEDVTSIKVTKDDDLCYTVEIQLKGSGSSIETSPLHFALDEKDTEEFALVLKGYHRLLTGQTSNFDSSKEIPVYWDVGPSWWADSAPSYHGQHLVKVAPWSYPPSDDPNEMRMINLSLPPPRYLPSDLTIQSSSSSSIYSYYPNDASSTIPRSSHLDHNMNNSTSSSSSSSGSTEASKHLSDLSNSVISRDLFESHANGSINDNDDENERISNSEEIRKRVMEMNKIIADAESYLNEGGEISSSTIETQEKIRDDDEEITDPCDHHPQLKAADSLLFLAHIDDHAGKEKVKAEGESVDDLSPCESDTDVESLITTNGNSSHHVQSMELMCLKSTDYDKVNGYEYNQQINSDTNNSFNGNSNSNSKDSSTINNSNKITIPIPGNNNNTGSSFGLHSPDVIPSLSDTENDLIETLKQLQNPGEYQIPFSDTTLYLDHDIIDLTAIPPPKTPDLDSSLINGALQSSPLSSSPPYAFSYFHNNLQDSTMMPYRDEIDGRKSQPPPPLLSTAQPESLSETDLMCDSLKDFHIYSGLSSLTAPSAIVPAAPVDLETLKSLPQDIDKFIATVTVPPPTTVFSSQTFDLDNGYESNKNDCDYLSSLIIPPPPMSSPRFTQEQDEIIARFWKATDDVRKVCNERRGVDDSSPRLSCRGLHSSSSGDSGYDSIINSTPFFSSSSSSSSANNNTVLNNNNNNSNNNNSSDWSSPSPYADTNYQKFFLPTVEENPKCRDSYNVFSRLTINRSASNATSSSSNTSSSTTPYLDLISLTNSNHHQLPDKRISESSSCDDLYSFSRMKENELSARSSDESADESAFWKPHLIKSHSWTSLQRSRAHGKPPLPPHSVSRLSERRKMLPCKKNGLAYIEISKDRNNKDYQKMKKFPVNQVSSLSESSSPRHHLDYDNYTNNLDFMSLPLQGESYNDFSGVTVGENDDLLDQDIIETEGRSDVVIVNTNTSRGGLLNGDKLEEIFIQSQRDIDTLLVRLEEVHESRLRSHHMYNPCDIEKYKIAKEALLVESRHFVTASKLFVKCATEASPLMIDHLLACVSLLERMFDIGKSVVIHLESQAHITCLVDRLKEVAATYGYTVDTVHKLTDGLNETEDTSSSPYMGLLMNHAGNLATSLSALMRTLRALN